MTQVHAVDDDPLLSELNALLESGAIAGFEAEPAREARAPKVLVVDDSQDYRDIVRALLEQNGFEVLDARDGSEGLRRALAERPDLVLLDFHMPVMNGYELLQELRGDFDLRRIPIVMFTGAGNRKRLKEMGLHVHAFLEKPVSSFRLLEAVHGALGGPPVKPALPHQVVLDPRPMGRAAPPAADPQEGLPAAGEVVLDPRPMGRAARPAADPQEGLPAAGEVVLDPRPIGCVARPSADSLDGLQAAGEVLIDAEKAVLDEKESGLEMLTQDSPLINYVNRILQGAVQLGASDIHIEPQEKVIQVRVRLNGALSQLCTLPAALSARLSARIKIISSLVITERRRPQDGQFRITAHGRKTEFRVSIMPGIHGEKIVLRVLGAGKVKESPSEIGFNSRDLECVEKAVQSQNGLILVTGPTGSGKTTTLYTMIGLLNKPDVNIMTAEDPVEYQVPGITQVQVKPAIGLTFDAVLRSLLRQDPDIMLIGEIRDLETAEIAVKASITGHLVLSTLHTNSAAASITRLTQMGIKPFQAAASLRMVVAQRLVKLLCANCKLQVPLSEAEKKTLTEAEQAPLREIYRGVGCSACGQTGYSGRRPVFEVMPIRTTAMRQLILTSNDVDAITALASAEGMSSLRQSALALAASGDTSLSEALKIVLSE